MAKKVVKFYSMGPMNDTIHQEIIESFSDFFNSKNYILGPNVEKFESDYSIFNNTKFCIGTSNGLDALVLSLKSLNIGNGDEVIIPSNTFIATVLAVIHCGAIPVFAEPSIETYNLDHDLLNKVLTKKTKAVIAVNLYGSPCDFTNILKFTEKNSLFLIEDNAQAQGATWNGKLTGSFGDVNAVSFYPAKNLGAYGDAGAITTNNKNLYLNIKLKYLKRWNNERIKIANFYFNELADIEELVLPKIHTSATSVFHIFNVRTRRRDQLKKYLYENGIETLIHYPIPPHLQKCFKFLKIKERSLPIAEELAQTSLSLPIWPGIEDDDIEYVANKIKAFFK